VHPQWPNGTSLFITLLGELTSLPRPSTWILGVLRLKEILTRSMDLSSGNVEEVQQFTYLGSIVRTDGGTEEDVKSRLGKARVAFHMLDNLWKSKVISRHTKLKISNSNVKSVLLYGSETWRTTKQIH